MSKVEDLIRSDYVHRGVVYQPPNNRKLIIAPAHRSNYSMPQDGRYRGTRQHLGAVIHTPEEPADDNEVTPKWFQNPKANASTDAYGDNDGDLYAMVPSIGTSWAQGVHRKRWFTVKDGKKVWHNPTDRYVVEKRKYPDWFPKLDGVVLSTNQFLSSIEVEGYANRMEDTFVPNGNQFDTLCSWVGWQMWVYEWEGIDRLLSHKQISTWKTDPGEFVIGLFPEIYKQALIYRNSYEAQAQDLLTPSAPDVAPTHDDAIESLREEIQGLRAQTEKNTQTIKAVQAAWRG